MGPIGLVLSLGAALGLGGGQVHRFERLAASEIHSHLSGARAVVAVRAKPNGVAALWGDVSRVTIRAGDFEVDELPFYTEPQRSKSGKLAELRLELSDFKMHGVGVESLVASIPGSRYDFGLALKKHTFRLSRSGVGQATIRVRQEEIGAFILRKFPEVKEVTVRADRGKLWVEGVGEFLLLRTRFLVIGELGPGDGVRLPLVHAKVYLDGLPANKGGVMALVDALNPVLDLDKDLGLHGVVKVERIDLAKGVAEIQGSIKIPNLP